MNPYHPHCYHECHPVTAVPEPATWLLILVGLAAPPKEASDGE